MSTDLAIINTASEQYPILASGGGKMAEVLAENFGGEAISPEDLLKIKVPTGGGRQWAVGTEATATLDGVILHIARRRGWWENPNPTGDPPSCSSNDCLTGIGKPGGACDKCPFNEFGTSRKQDGTEGRGKACREMKLLFLMRPGMVLPDVVCVPPGSLKSIKAYQVDLSKRGIFFWSVVTRLELEPDRNKDGTAYSKIKPSALGHLPPESAQQLMEFAKSLQATFAGVGLEGGDGEDGDTVTV